MNPAQRRSIEVDFLRGTVLLVIMIDHITGSLLTHFTLHEYAYCDAAEVFVFLGGYATAAAYTSIEQRGIPGAARRRFFKRSWEIYRAYLLTAALMVIAGLVMLTLQIHPTELPYTDAQQWLNHPVRTLFDIVALRNQPYLASVLPMYAMFALLAPLSVPFARSTPLGAILISLGIWLCSVPLARMLPSADPGGWGFNPFAWQLMFVGGMLTRLHPLPHAFYTSRLGKRLTYLALGLFLLFAFCKLVLQTQPDPGHWKQNLAAVRVVSFAAIAWLVAQTVRLGWLGKLAGAMPAVVRVGRVGLVCFIVGTAISIFFDTALQTIGVRPDTGLGYGVGLISDVLSIALLLWVAHLAQSNAARQKVPHANSPGVPRRPPA